MDVYENGFVSLYTIDPTEALTSTGSMFETITPAIEYNLSDTERIESSQINEDSNNHNKNKDRDTNAISEDEPEEEESDHTQSAQSNRNNHNVRSTEKLDENEDEQEDEDENEEDEYKPSDHEQDKDEDGDLEYDEEDEHELPADDADIDDIDNDDHHDSSDNVENEEKDITEDKNSTNTPKSDNNQQNTAVTARSIPALVERAEISGISTAQQKAQETKYNIARFKVRQKKDRYIYDEEREQGFNGPEAVCEPLGYDNDQLLWQCFVTDQNRDTRLVCENASIANINKYYILMYPYTYSGFT